MLKKEFWKQFKNLGMEVRWYHIIWTKLNNHHYMREFVSIVVAQSLSHVPLFVIPMDSSKPGSPVLHYLLEFAQIHVHLVSDAISSSATPFTFCLQFSQHQSFPVSQLFASGDKSIGPSVSGLVLPVNIQGWFPFELTDWISLQSKGLMIYINQNPST